MMSMFFFFDNHEFHILKKIQLLGIKDMVLGRLE